LKKFHDNPPSPLIFSLKVTHLISSPAFSNVTDETPFESPLDVNKMIHFEVLKISSIRGEIRQAKCGFLSRRLKKFHCLKNDLLFPHDLIRGLII
jgi:hypothetical protein